MAPPARRQGLGTRLAELALSSAPVDSAWSHGDHPAAARLARRFGFTRARELWVMRRALDTPLPDLEVPDGIQIRGFQKADREALLQLNAAAFAHHPEQAGMDADDLAARMAEPWYDAADLLLGFDRRSGRLVGFHWTKVHSSSLGEVYVVGIDPTAHGRGLGTLLTLAGLHHLAGRGVGEILLYVESDNAAAITVYARLGFTHAERDTHVQYQRPAG